MGSLVQLPRLNLTRAHVSLSWVPVSPLTERLHFAIIGKTAAEERRVFCMALGTSPIELDCKLGPVRAGESYELGVFPAPIVAPPETRAVVWLATEQPFRIQGALILAEASP